jgi:cytochrome c553
MKVVKQMVLTMTNLDEEDMVMLAEEYRKSHPDDNHSQEEVEILAL